MKKPALLILGLLLISFIGVYFIIPQNIDTASISRIYATDLNVFKFIIKENSWQKWWPGKHTNHTFTYNNVTYTLQKGTNSSLQVNIKTGDTGLDSHITYTAADEGLTTVSWVAHKQSSLNPFERIAEFIRIKNTGKDMKKILEHFKQFMQKDINVYGIKVTVEKVADPVLIATHTTSATYPTTGAVYQLISNVKKQIASKNVKETNKPMLNITKIDDKVYQIMVAIPVNKDIIPDTGYVLNRMVKGGNILEAQVKGGRNTIDNALNQLRIYAKDHQLVSPAMPYELIVTDRLAEKDTAKWVTKIYYPVL